MQPYASLLDVFVANYGHLEECSWLPEHYRARVHCDLRIAAYYAAIKAGMPREIADLLLRFFDRARLRVNLTPPPVPIRRLLPRVPAIWTNEYIGAAYDLSTGRSDEGIDHYRLPRDMYAPEDVPELLEVWVARFRWGELRSFPNDPRSPWRWHQQPGYDRRIFVAVLKKDHERDWTFVMEGGIRLKPFLLKGFYNKAVASNRFHLLDEESV